VAGVVKPVTGPRVGSAGPAARRAAAEDAEQYACAQAWSALSAAHAQVSERLGAALTRRCDLSINDFEVLLRLKQAGAAGLRLGELNKTVRLSQPALSRLASRLERHGLLRRGDDPGDRRGVLVAITAAGRTALRRAIPVHAACMQAVLLGRLTPGEQQVLVDVLNRVAEQAH
jgi:DNA-binding MarR family transcriptional regulator